MITGYDVFLIYCYLCRTGSSSHLFILYSLERILYKHPTCILLIKHKSSVFITFKVNLKKKRIPLKPYVWLPYCLTFDTASGSRDTRMQQSRTRLLARKISSRYILYNLALQCHRPIYLDSVLNWHKNCLTPDHETNYLSGLACRGIGAEHYQCKS